MKDCPECGHRMKDEHERCVKCGAEYEAPEPAAVEAPPKGARQHLEKARYLQELVPSRSRLAELLPHPSGWVLGIGIPVIVALAIIHALIYPVDAEANGDAKKAKKPDVTAAQQSQFKRCLRQARAKADLECKKITGTAEGVRRMTCTVARLSADYSSCTMKLGGRFGRCLGRCGQAARSCSSSCAAQAPQGWMDTAKCLLPCWKDRLQSCVSTCFQSRSLDADPDPTPSAI